MQRTNCQSVRWGMVGCGKVTEVKSGPAFSKVPQSELLAVVSRNSDRTRDYAARHQVATTYTNTSDLFNDPVINAVYIATPPDSHEEYAVAAMNAGKSVYVEKPMSIDAASCLRMVEVSEQTGTKLCVAHYRRALPMFLHIKKLLNEGTIGKVQTIQMHLIKPASQPDSNNWRVDPGISGGGMFYDLGPHQLDLMLYFFGAYHKASGNSTNLAGLYVPEDVVTGMIHFADGPLFSGLWNFISPAGTFEDRCVIRGSAGAISFPVFGDSITVENGTRKNTLFFKHPEHIQQPMIAKVVQYFLGDGSNPCSGMDGSRTLELMEKYAIVNSCTCKSGPPSEYIE